MIAETPVRLNGDVAIPIEIELAESNAAEAASNVPSLRPKLPRRRLGLAHAAKKLPSWLQPSLISTVATSFGTFGITAVQGIILARMLGPEGRGEFGTAIFYSTTLTFIGMLGAQYAVARRAASGASTRHELARSAMRLGIWTGLGTIVVVAGLAFTTLPATKLFLAPLCLVAAMSLPLEHMRQLLLAVDQGSGEFRRYNAVVLTTSIVFPLLLLILWGTSSASVFTVVTLSLAPPAVGLGLRLAMSRPALQVAAVAAPSQLELVKEGRPYLFSLAVCDLYQRLDQFLILFLGGLVTQGLYAAAVPAASTLQVGATALALFSFNAGSRQDSHRTPRQLLNAGITLAAFQLLTGLVFALLVGQLILLFYGTRFAAAVPFALALIPAHAINGFTQVVEGHLRGLGNVRIGIVARIAAAVVMLAITALLFGRFRELSVPIAATVANAVVAIALSWFTLVNARRVAGAADERAAEVILP